ncbi:MAG: SDR family oxidoreductase [Candidatus Sumerlaeia bacterium]|nr:SDR family oxidoreductase [Candidatus Sumerlaeia bacterium]
MAPAQMETAAPVVAPANRLAGKVALVTGGTRGIGLAVAKAYAREGAKLIIASRTSSELKNAMADIKALGADVTATRVDLSTRASCESLYTGAIRSYGKIDILVNNAGVLGPLLPIVNYPADEWDRVMRTNTDAVYWLTRAVLGNMIPNNGGSIINVTSGVGIKGRANWGAYAASKAAVINFTETISEEISKYGIRINCINPGATRTMMREEAFPKEDPATLPHPNDIVNAFIYLASDVAKGTTGMTFQASDWVGRQF